jgi:phosphoenolpyruvate-protein kinase (PTS system EI component)
MKMTHKQFLTTSVLVCVLALTALAQDTKKEKQQQDVRDVAHKTLQQLYKTEPHSKAAIKQAAGYAVFNNME